jgi:hypothetical protein
MLEPFIHLTYASTTTFTSNVNRGIESAVARILLQSCRNNPEAGLGGVLHFREGYFSVFRMAKRPGK